MRGTGRHGAREAPSRSGGLPGPGAFPRVRSGEALRRCQPFPMTRSSFSGEPLEVPVTRSEAR